MTAPASATEPTATALPRFHWFLPPRNDSLTPGAVTTLGAEGSSTPPNLLDHLTEVAVAAEQGGFHGALTPIGIGCPDPWVLCSAVAARTKDFSFIVAVRPSLQSATLTAQQADTFRRLHRGRVILNIVTGGNPAEQAGYGVHVPHDERYDITDESLRAIRPLLQGDKVELDGKHMKLVGSQLVDPATEPVPIFFGGASEKAVQVAAEQADTYLLWGEPLPAISERIDTVRAAAAAAGRHLDFGLRLHVITRDTAEEAWQVAADIQSSFDPEEVAKAQAHKATMDSVGQARMGQLHGTELPSDVQDLVIAPNLWAGIGLMREGVGTALVGSHDEVADRLVEYAELGIGEFILSGYPHREEATRVGRDLLPLIHQKLSATAGDVTSSAGDGDAAIA